MFTKDSGSVPDTDKELQQVSEQLARANQDMEQFAYVVSHDLQEPLRMVTSYLQLLERRYPEALDADGREFIAYAVDGAARMKTMIGALLEYSRVSTRGKPFEFTDVNAVVARVLKKLAGPIGESGAAVTCGPLPAVWADPAQLTQLFQHLLGNALKFRGEAVPEIHISADRDDETVVFSVRDNGIGLRADDAERVFVVLQRLHGRDEYPGAGIGLAVGKRIVERHGGRIWIESEPGAGATFRFTVPNHPSQEPTEADPS